jgi:transcriptional regulator with XRE-family HTH domain
MDSKVLDTKKIRERAGDGFSQAALAEIAFVDQSAVSLWETDKNAPRRSAAAHIKQFCKSRGIKLSWKPKPPKRGEA